MSDSVNHRIKSISWTARSITTPTFDIRGGNGPTRVIAIDRMSSPEIACLTAATAGLKALDMSDHQGHAGALCGSNDFLPLLDRRRDRLFDQHMNVVRDAGQRDLVMQMRRCGDGDGVDAFRDQFVDAREGAAADQFGSPRPMFGQRIDDSDQYCIGQASQHAGMIAAHDAGADDPDAKRAFGIGFHTGCGTFGNHRMQPQNYQAPRPHSPAPWFS